MKQYLLFIAILSSVLSLTAAVVNLDRSTRFEVPADIRQCGIRHGDVVWEGESDNLALTVKAVMDTPLDIIKIRANGDTIMFPELQGAELIYVSREPFYRWARNYEIHTYRDAKGDTLYTYHMSGEHQYIFMIKAKTPGNTAQIDDIMESITNDAWFSNAALWWSLFVVVLLFFLLILTEKDKEFKPLKFVKRFLMVTSVCALFGLIVCWGDWGAYRGYLTFIAVFVSIVLLLNKPLRWITGTHRGLVNNRHGNNFIG